MSRTKKAATKAIEELRNYLKRDPGGSRMVDDISRYVGELRSTQRDLKANNEHLKDISEASRKRVDEHKKQLDELRRELQQAHADCRQAHSDRSRSEVRAEMLQTLLDADPDDMPEEMWSDKSQLVGLFMSLRKSMRRLPKPESAWKKGFSEKVMVFDPQKIAQTYSADGYLRLGQFVLVATGIGFPIGFKPSGGIGKLSEGKTGQLVKFMKNWIHYTDIENQSLLPRDPNRPHDGCKKDVIRKQ